jgi:imidazolonepropionase-like amidohydrolase
MPRTIRRVTRAVALLAAAAAGCGGNADDFVVLRAPAYALTHLWVIDGSGRPALDDQTVIVEGARIRSLGPSASTPLGPDVRSLDLTGRTVLPGLVGMHDHLYYEVERGSGTLRVTPQSAFAKLYLASGVTTIRTTGSIDLAGDVRLKRRIDNGDEPGPLIHLTGPYLNAIGEEPDPEAVARQVFAAADMGATSIKAYTTLRTTELWAAIQAARARKLQVAGHLCAVGFREAASLGIDSLEHGLVTDTEFYSRKEPDRCPDQGAVFGELARMQVGGREIRETIAELVGRNVAVTSTLAVVETYTGHASSVDPRTLLIFSNGMRDIYLAARGHWSDPNGAPERSWTGMLAKEMQFERAFVAAGGRLMAGVDPTGWGGVVAGFGDQRELELLVDAGFSPEMAIRIATANGAGFLRETTRGTIAAGMQADLVVVRGDPSRRIADVRNIELVFKDGIGYDPAKLIEATNGAVTQYDLSRLFRWPWNAVIGALVAALVARITWRLSRRRRSGGVAPIDD